MITPRSTIASTPATTRMINVVSISILLSGSAALPGGTPDVQCICEIDIAGDYNHADTMWSNPT
jgi:hypothetical protein